MKAIAFREMSDAELSVKLTELKQELFNLRFSHATGQLANPMQMVNCKYSTSLHPATTTSLTHCYGDSLCHVRFTDNRYRSRSSARSLTCNN